MKIPNSVGYLKASESPRSRESYSIIWGKDLYYLFQVVCLKYWSQKPPSKLYFSFILHTAKTQYSKPKEPETTQNALEKGRQGGEDQASSGCLCRRFYTLCSQACRSLQNFPKTTLHNHISEKTLPAKQAHEAQQVLSSAEEAAIGTWIKKGDDFGFPPRRRMFIKWSKVY